MMATSDGVGCDKIRLRLRFDIPPPLYMSPIAKYYMILINKKELQCISDIEYYISHKFGYASSQSLVLSIDGYLLLPNDDIDILRDNDEVAVNIEDIFDSSNLATFRNRKYSKRKEHSNGTDITKKKHVKCVKETSVANMDYNELQNCSKIENYPKLSKKKRKHKKQRCRRKDITSTIESPSTETSDQVAKENCKHICKISSKNSKCIKNVSPIPCVDQEAHISNGNETNHTIENTNEPETSNEPCMLDHLSLTVRNPLEDSSDGHVSGESHMLSVKDTVSVIECTGTKPSEIVQHSNLKKFPLVTDYSTLPCLSWPPRCNDLIAFKHLEMTENYSPQISSYKEAKVIEVCGGTSEYKRQVITVEMLWPKPSRKPQNNGRFEIVLDTDITDGKAEEHATLEWNTLLGARLIY